MHKVNWKISANVKKPCALIISPRYNVTSDYHKIITSYINDIRKTYNNVSLYNTQSSSYDGYYGFDNDNQFMYTLCPASIDTSEIDCVFYIGIIKGKCSNLFIDMVEHIKFIFNKVKSIYTPILLNYIKDEYHDNLEVQVNNSYISFMNMDNEFADYYRYTYNMYGRYNLSTILKPYICCIPKGEMQVDHYMEPYLSKFEYYNNKFNKSIGI